MNSHRLCLITTILILAFTLAACAPAVVPPVIFYSRVGGIAGFCDKVTIFAGGQAQVASCHNNATSQVTLSSEQSAQIAGWQANLAGYTYDHSDAAVADGMTIHLVFSGNGKRAASLADQQAMLSMASEIALSASK